MDDSTRHDLYSTVRSNMEKLDGAPQEQRLLNDVLEASLKALHQAAAEVRLDLLEARLAVAESDIAQSQRTISTSHH